MQATSDDLSKKANALARSAVESNTPVKVTHYRKPYVQILPAGLAERALEALAREEETLKAS